MLVLGLDFFFFNWFFCVFFFLGKVACVFIFVLGCFRIFACLGVF